MITVQNIYRSVWLPYLENYEYFVMFSKAGMYLLNESGAKCRHSRKGLVLSL